MTNAFFSREQVAERFSVEQRVLNRYEARGLVRAVHRGSEEGYGPDEVRRLWTILSLQRDLGVNLAGVEAILRLRSHVDLLHARLDRLAGEMRELLDSLEEEPADD